MSSVTGAASSTGSARRSPRSAGAASGSTPARRFITPSLTAGLLEIACGETGSARYVTAATRRRGFYLAIPRSGDFLALGALFRSLNVAEDDFHQCLADLALPRRVIEALGAA